LGGPPLMLRSRALGRSGLHVSVLGLGCAPIGDIRRAPSETDTWDLLESAWDRGIRYFDTAPYYGAGLSERRLGDFLRTRPRGSYVLSTKVGRLLRPDPSYRDERYGGDQRALPFRPYFDFSADGVVRSFEMSLQRLGLDSIDILLLHDIGRFAQGDEHDAQWSTALSGAIPALMRLREEGVIKAIGAGVNENQACLDLMDQGYWDCFLLAGRFTLLDQSGAADLLPRCMREQTSVILGAPFNSGILATGAIGGARFDYRPAREDELARVAAIEAVCRKWNIPLAAAALAFPFSHNAITTVIAGSSTPQEFQQNWQHLHTPIPQGLWADLHELGLISSPFGEISTPILSCGIPN
jgi:D-threo-aldose 1-dehydrogenase